MKASPQNAEVLVVVRDEDFAARLVAQLRDRSVAAAAGSNLVQAVSLLEALRPELLVVDACVDHDADCRVVAQLRARGHPLPFIELNHGTSMSVTDDPMRLGAFHLPANSQEHTGALVTAIVQAVSDVRLIQGLRSAAPTQTTQYHALATVIGVVPDAILVTNDVGRILLVNDEAVRMFQCDRGDLVGQPVSYFMPHELRASHDSHVHRYFRSASEARIMGSGRTGLTAVRRDGERFPVDIRLCQVVARGGDKLAVASIRDLTVRRDLETRLRQTERLEAVGRLAGGIAHDFNNIVTAILSFTTFAIEGMQADHPSQPDLQEVIAAGRQAQRLTAQLLAFSRKQPITKAPFSVGAAVDELFGMVSKLVGAAIRTEVVVTHAVVVDMDRGQFDQVVVNLCVNARDAMPDGGCLRVFVGLQEIGEEQASQDLPPGPYAELVVQDNGVGIDERALVRVFEPFFTTKDSGRGTGLGLATVYGVVKQNGGHVSVASERGQGSTFRVLLPATKKTLDSTRACSATRASGVNTVGGEARERSTWA